MNRMSERADADRGTVAFEVRDYECDLQGIVNNAVYQHYLEHARHQFLRRLGVSFAELAQQGINLVVIRAEIDYQAPLRSGDAFVVGVRLKRISPIRLAFLQDIHRLCGGQLAEIVRAKIICAAVNREGKPTAPTALEAVFRACGDGAVRTDGQSEG